MQTKKMSLANIAGKLSRAQMKNIMAGSGGGCRVGSCGGPNYCAACVCIQVDPRFFNGQPC